MAKYKVGDKVRISEDAVDDAGFFSSSKMKDYLGKTVTVEKVDIYGSYRVEENSWLWTNGMIEGLANNKVEFHPDFKDWYEEIGEHWTNQHGQKSFAIYLINQMGFGKGLENSYGEDISEVYPSLRYDMQGSKEKYTRAILDDNWTARKENPLYYVKFPIVSEDFAFLNKNEKYGYLFFGIKNNRSGLKNKFTEKEIKAIDERYWEFKVPVDKEEL